MSKPQEDIENSVQVLDITVLTTRSSESTVSDVDQDHVYDQRESKYPNNSRKSLLAKLKNIMTMNIIPDDIVQHTILQKINLTLSVELFRLVKFLACTYSLILSAIVLIRWIVSSRFFYQVII